MEIKDSKTHALINRQADFWLLGGISVAVWFVLLVAQNFKELSFIQAHFNNLPYTMATLALVANYPHFLASYRLGYTRGFKFIWQNWFQMLVAPSLLIGILGAAYFIPMIPQAVLLGYMVNLMYLTVGWHYTKQAFGCTMVYAKYDNYKISKWQKELLRWGLLSIWWVTLVQSNLYGSKANFYGLNFMQWNFYDWLYPVSLFLSGLSFFGILIFVFLKNWRTNKAWPSANMLIPFIAMCVWWLPVARQNEFYIYLTPFFHSLQYLVFIYKFETVSAAEKSANSQTLIWVTLFLIISGWAAFELIPNGLDQAFMSTQNLSIPFFLIAFNLFINIHHYFIDNAIWRFKDPEVKKHILGA